MPELKASRAKLAPCPIVACCHLANLMASITTMSLHVHSCKQTTRQSYKQQATYSFQCLLFVTF